MNISKLIENVMENLIFYKSRRTSVLTESKWPEKYQESHWINQKTPNTIVPKIGPKIENKGQNEKLKFFNQGVVLLKIFLPHFFPQIGFPIGVLMGYNN